MKSYLMTRTGKAELEKELAYLKEVKQAALKEKIKVARGFCDFGEDVVFGEIIDRQAEIEADHLLIS